MRLARDGQGLRVNFPEDEFSGKGIAAARKHFAEEREKSYNSAVVEPDDSSSSEDQLDADDEGDEAIDDQPQKPSEATQKDRLVPVEDVAKQREKKRLAQEEAQAAKAQVDALHSQLQRSNALIAELRSQMDELRGGQKATQDLFQKLAPAQPEQPKQVEPACPFDPVMEPGEYFNWHMDLREAKLRAEYEKKLSDKWNEINPDIETLKKSHKMTEEERQAVAQYNEFQSWLNQQTELDPLTPEYFKAAEEFYTENHPGAIESGSIPGDVFLRVGKRLLAGKGINKANETQATPGAQPEQVQVKRKQSTPSLDGIGGGAASQVDSFQGLENAQDEDDFNRELKSRGATTPDSRRKVINEMNAKLASRARTR